MVSLEQIRALETRVEKAVLLIDRLRKENLGLEQRLGELSRASEQARADAAALERKAQAGIAAAAESASRLDALASKARLAEDRAAEADLRAADAEERAALFERKAQASEAELASYRERALAAEQKAVELESRAQDLRKEQARIEEGLVHALDKLDAFEDLVMGRAVDQNLSFEAGAADMEPVAADNFSSLEAHDREGDNKVEAADESPSAPAPQALPFPGNEDELDIF